MPALAPICENSAAVPTGGGKSPKRKTRSASSSADTAASRTIATAPSSVRRSRRRRKSTLLGLENNIYCYYQMPTQSPSPDKEKFKETEQWASSDSSGLDSAPSAPSRDPGSPQAPAIVVTQPSPPPSADKATKREGEGIIVVENEPNRSETTTSTHVSTDVAMVIDSPINTNTNGDGDGDAQKEGNPLSLDDTMALTEEETTEKENNNNSSPLLSSEESKEDDHEDVDASSEGGDRKETTPTTSSSPSDVVDVAEAESVPLPRSKSRLSLLLSLRPPPPTKSSILRRKCTPAEKGAVYDGTAREESALNPTSDRHFDALAAFEVSSKPPTATAIAITIANQKNATGSELLVIDMETLRKRLNELFPQQFSLFAGVQVAAKPRRGKKSFVDDLSQPPCIFPRLIACYTIYRDYQRQQQTQTQQQKFQKHDLEESPTSNISLSNDNDSEISIKRRRTMNGAEQTEATLSAVKSSVSESVESLSPIRNLLQKLVDLEWIVLEGHEHRDEEEGKSTSFGVPSSKAKSSFASCWKKLPDKIEQNNHHRKKRVQFAAFDGYAVVRGPSDVIEGSYKPQDNCVKALMSVLNAVEEIFPKATSPSHTRSAPPDIEDQSASSAATATATATATAIVCDFIFYLDNEFIPQCHDTICVESLMAIENQNIPIGRVEKAAFAYSRDLDSLIHPKGTMTQQLLAVVHAKEERIRGDDGDDNEVVVPLLIQTVDVFVRSRPLSWEFRLANTSAQLVRYWLRTLMNPIPERSDCDTKTNQWNSRLYDCVNLFDLPDEVEFNTEINNEGNGETDADVDADADVYIATDEDDRSVVTFDDDKLSSLLSNALAHLYAYLDLRSASSVSWKDLLQKVIPDDTCCATTVCLDGLGSARKPVFFTDDDWQEVREHLEEASDFCAFHRRALFIERLLSIVEKLDWVDYWTHTVQKAAQKLVRLQGNNSDSNTNININTASPLGKIISKDDNPDREGNVTSSSGSDDSIALGRVIQPEDEHLIVLGMPLKELLERLRTQILPKSCHRYEICRTNLRRTEKNFRLGFSTTKRKKNCRPDIVELEAYWKDRLHPDTIFPSVSFRGYPDV
jgi:hypothetical protein